MSAQPIGEYRGCIILLYPRDTPLYGNSCTAGLRYTIARVKQDIDVYRDGHPEPPTPEPPPPEPKDYIVETYRGVDIWFLVDLERYRAVVATGYTAIATTLTQIRIEIDEILELLNPPEEPPDGLFAQVVAAVKVWVLENIQPWVETWGKIVQNFITNTTEYITNVANYITENITNVVNNLSEYVTNVYTTTREYITNVFNEYNEYVTNVHNTFNEYVTNIIGVSEESVNEKIKGVTSWTLGLFAVLDPHGLLKDPQGYIKGAFDTLIAPWGQGIVKAFWEGFEEGLEE